MDDDEQGASRKAALKYAGPRSDGKEESFIEVKAELENAMGLMAMALARDDVSCPTTFEQTQRAQRQGRDRVREWSHPDGPGGP
jgi:hypothetical protein